MYNLINHLVKKYENEKFFQFQKGKKKFKN